MGPRYAEVLTPAALRFLAELHRAFEGPRERLLAARAEQQQRYDAGELPDFRPGTKVIRDDPDWRVAPIPPDLQDRRVEITGPVDRKMIVNALNSGAQRLHGGFRGRQCADLGQQHRGPDQPEGPLGRQARLRRSGEPQALPARRQSRGADRAAARLASGRRAPDGRRRADLRRAVRFRALLLPQRAGADRSRHRTLLLPAEARDARGGAAVERGVRVRAGAARHSERHDPRDRADRDAARRLRDGGDPLRAARPRGRAECRALGLHLLLHQEAREEQGLHPARSRPGGDGRGLPRRLCGAAGEDLSRARRLRDGRHGGADPDQGRRRRERGGVRESARRQGARGARRL